MLLPNHSDEAEVELMVVIAPDVPNTLFLDETYIHRILMNLLSNSLKFTKSGYVLLSLEMKDGNLVANLKDTGTGIPPSFLDEVFEPFSQAQTRGSQRGTGLGLSIVKQLVHKMQGTITVESVHADQGVSPNETGTTFTVTIPAQMPYPGPSTPQPSLEAGTVALLYPVKPRILEGLKMAWALFGCDVVVVQELAELSNSQIKYIWADASILKCHPEWLQQLLSQNQWTILVPFDHQESVQQLHGLLSAPHFVPLQKPLMWHTFQGRIAIASHASSNIDASLSVRPASEKHTADKIGPSTLNGSMVLKEVNILLVEDNIVRMHIFQTQLRAAHASFINAHTLDQPEAWQQDAHLIGLLCHSCP